MKPLFLVLCLIIYIFPFSLASTGDQSPYYRSCLSKCKNANCTRAGTAFVKEAAPLQDPWSRILGWTCLNECQYQCMWKTVNAFIARGYPIAKFHGKWPFKRMLGMQEPASCLCSLLNLCSHLVMWSKFHRRINCHPAADTHRKLIMFWNVFFAVCITAWLCSAAFHARDTPVTEFADYAGALSMVMALFVAAVVRAFYKAPKIRWVVTVVTLLQFAAHVQYLYAGHIDYMYNMKVNIIFGGAASVLWMVWSAHHMRRYKKQATYVGWLQGFVVVSGGAVLLEVWEVPPYRFVWDTHALWHLATAPLPLMFYRFVIHDLEFLISVSVQEKTNLKLA